MLFLAPLFFFTLWYGRKELNKMIKSLNMFGEPYSLRHPYKFALAFLFSVIYLFFVFYIILSVVGVV